MSSGATEILRFAQLQSVVDVTFLAELSEYKLNVLKLSEDPVDIVGYFSPNRYEAVPARLQLDVSSLRPSAASRQDGHAVPGVLHLFNTLEGFRDCDKPGAMRQAAAALWSDILSGAAESQPALLYRFLLLMHGDLKHYKFHYWFAFPALKPPSPFTCAATPASLAAALPAAAVDMITAACVSWRYSTIAAPSQPSQPSPPATAADILTSANPNQPSAAAATPNSPTTQPGPLTPADVIPRTPAPFWLLSSSTADFTADVTAHSLTEWAALAATGPTHRSVAPTADATDAAAAAAAAAAADHATGAVTSANTVSGTGDKSQKVVPEVDPGLYVSTHGSPSGGRYVLVVMADPAHQPGHPGWGLRNLLLMAAVRWRVESLRVLCLRELSRGGGRLDPQRSLLIQVTLPPVPVPVPGVKAPMGAASEAGVPEAPCPEAVGWEANAQGRLLPRFLDLGPHLRPEAQAEQAVDLNLRLMRWRAVPELEVAAMGATKCLLLGAGTLGCAVARTLQAWGVRHITMVDSGRVAFSNPVRQSLYNFDDCLGGGRPKAEAAAEALRRIFPSAVARGVDLSIPMPGHPPAGPAEEERMKLAAQQLDTLIAEHDAVFLLTDTRESRWLPALLAAVYGKIALTAAVGFDSFLVMRHGAPPGRANTPSPSPALHTSTAAGVGVGGGGSSTPATAAPAGSSGGGGGGGAPCCGSSGIKDVMSPAGAVGRRLGCYFCNDIVAPANSTRDRSLDQQCTVARPGLAPVAGALAVELLAALVTGAGGVEAPPPSVQQSTMKGDDGPPLGAAPHMIRGQLASFSQVVMEGWAFGQCTACGPAVVGAYRERGWGLVEEAVRRPAYLEELTGLAELHAAAAAAMERREEGRGEEGGEGAGEEGEAGGEGGEDGEEEDWTEL